MKKTETEFLKLTRGQKLVFGAIRDSNPDLAVVRIDTAALKKMTKYPYVVGVVNELMKLGWLQLISARVKQVSQRIFRIAEVEKDPEIALKSKGEGKPLAIKTEAELAALKPAATRVFGALQKLAKAYQVCAKREDIGELCNLSAPATGLRILTENGFITLLRQGKSGRPNVYQIAKIKP